MKLVPKVKAIVPPVPPVPHHRAPRRVHHVVVPAVVRDVDAVAAFRDEAAVEGDAFRAIIPSLTVL